ncbi:MarR family winged helix-turn-helix transcriptional regulator [Nocardioides daphniae]|uniref:MarR family transcriptional regulator n=1 Tax=Nocardioides daphniae TaxID=402297 RepID=A0A4P7UIG2_9ACTN|nr:MarR family transcriptional regulator [Nocardioides daphniae]QCC78329.1 MarR family transcriptional regulator [Nocardioides daphniae]GGD13514.1 MarR family transcriptional regulator [Nocardioides daphniae]
MGTTRDEARTSTPTPSPTTTSPPTSLPLLLRRIEHVLEQRIAEGIAPVLADLDLTPERWRVMATLAEEPGQTMTRLAVTAVLPPASLTRHVDRLVARGLVLRKTHARDRRRIVVALTDRGREAWARVDAEEQQVHESLRAALGPGRFDALVAELHLVPLALG